jgi:hypothetical protein
VACRFAPVLELRVVQGVHGDSPPHSADGSSHGIPHVAPAGGKREVPYLLGPEVPGPNGTDGGTRGQLGAAGHTNGRVFGHGHLKPSQRGGRQNLGSIDQLPGSPDKPAFRNGDRNVVVPVLQIEFAVPQVGRLIESVYVVDDCQLGVPLGDREYLVVDVARAKGCGIRNPRGPVELELHGTPGRDRTRKHQTRSGLLNRIPHRLFACRERLKLLERQRGQRLTVHLDSRKVDPSGHSNRPVPFRSGREDVLVQAEHQTVDRPRRVVRVAHGGRAPEDRRLRVQRHFDAIVHFLLPVAGSRLSRLAAGLTCNGPGVPRRRLHRCKGGRLQNEGGGGALLGEDRRGDRSRRAHGKHPDKHPMT